MSHHPPITAYYCENDEYICQGWFAIKTKLSLSGLQALPKGPTLFTLKKTNEQFSLNWPIISVHNLILGELFVWAEGLATCENLTTGHTAEMYLFPVGFFSKKEFKIEGKISDAVGNIKYKIHGNWNDSIYYVDG